MNLYDWLWSHRRVYTHKEFAKKLNISPSYLSRIINLKDKPSSALAKDIEKLTNGEVLWHDLIDHYDDHVQKNVRRK